MRPILSADRPSIVTTFLPAMEETGVVQDLTACPLTCTVHAPHTAMPPPYLVPVRPNSSRTTHISGVSGSLLEVAGFPFSVNVVAMRDPRILNSVERRRRGNVSAAPSIPIASPPRPHPYRTLDAKS